MHPITLYQSISIHIDLYHAVHNSLCAHPPICHMYYLLIFVGIVACAILCLVQVKKMETGKAIHRRSRFYFADLGGSEQLSKSKVDAATKAKVLVSWCCKVHL